MKKEMREEDEERWKLDVDGAPLDLVDMHVVIFIEKMNG